MQIVQLDEPYCPGDPVQLGTEVLSGTGTVTWSWSSNVDNATGGNANVSPSTNETFTVDAEDACGQTDEAMWTVLVPTFEPVVAYDIDLCPGESAVLGIEGGTQSYTFTDEDGTPLTAANGPGTEYGSNVVFTNETGSMYVGDVLTTTIVVVTDECGLSDQATVDVDICEMIIPNVFTPNGDNKNDEFQIQCLECYAGSDLRITNRWGNEVYSSTDYTGQWDGEGCPDGTYYYQFDRSDGQRFTGSVQILRERQ